MWKLQQSVTWNISKNFNSIFFASYQDHNWYITLEILNSKSSI